MAGVFHWQAVLVIKKLGDDLQSITLATARPAFRGHAKYATLSYYEPEMPPYYEACECVLHSMNDTSTYYEVEATYYEVVNGDIIV